MESSSTEVNDFLDRRAQEMQLRRYAESNELGNLTPAERAWLKIMARESKRIRDTENRDMTGDDMAALRKRVYHDRRR